MASYTATTTYDNYTLRIDVSESNVNVSANTSNVDWKLYIVNGGRRFDINNFSYSLSINGTQVANFSGRCNTTDVGINDPHFLASGSITVGHNNDGSKTVYCYAECNGRSQNGHGPGWGAVDGNFVLTNITRQANVTGATDFNDEGNPKITYTNPGGFRINARLEFGGEVIRRDNISNTGSYTFDLTESERTLLRQKCTGNSMTVREVIATCIGGTTETNWSWQDKTMTMVNANPIFSNFTFADINATTLALTGNNQNIIRNYSNVQVIISTTDKATAIKEATMNKYRFTCGDKNAPEAMTYSSDSSVTGTITEVPNGTFNVYATDSRNNSTLVTKLANEVINYTPLTKGNIDVVRSNGVSEETILTLSGKIDLVDFGDVVNSIQMAKYRYKTTDSSNWSNYINITLTVDANGNFSFEDGIDGDEGALGFNISNSYNIEVLIEDELSSITYTDTLNSGIPNIALHKNGVGIMGKYDENVGGLLQVNGMRIDGVYSTNEMIIGKWTDDKPVYRKVISTSIGISGRVTINHDISNLKNVINIYGNLLRNDNTQFIVTRISDDGNHIGISSINDTRILFHIPSAFGNSITDANIIVEYTKTTD